MNAPSIRTTAKIEIDFRWRSCAKSRCYSVLCASERTRGAVENGATLHDHWPAAKPGPEKSATTLQPSRFSPGGRARAQPGRRERRAP
ncbi:MAG: hypothetical protein E5X61_07105 [Mesorhizobium sp.]|nr:MAG: hypothetical protein E5X61_07105 [Mesorhizobium sp.]